MEGLAFVLFVGVIVAGIVLSSRNKWNYYAKEDANKTKKWEAYYAARAAGANVVPPNKRCDCEEE